MSMEHYAQVSARFHKISVFALAHGLGEHGSNVSHVNGADPKVAETAQMAESWQMAQRM